MAYDVDYPDLERRAATYVDRILKGAKPSDLPVQQPSKFALVINLKTAKALRLTISESFLVAPTSSLNDGLQADTTTPYVIGKVVSRLEMDSRWALARSVRALLVAERDAL